MVSQLALVLIPVFCLVALGTWYGKSRKPDPEWTNKMNMDWFLPALIFSALSTRSFDWHADGWLVLGTVGIILGSGLLAWPLVHFLKLDWRTFLPPVMFSNCGNIGLPLAMFTFGQALMPNAIVVFVTTNLLFFTLGAWLISGKTQWRNILSSPMVIATLTGFAMGASGWRFPPEVAKPIQLLGDISLPLMLFTLGIRMAEVKWADWQHGMLGAVLCPLTGILAAALVLPWLPLSPGQQAALILFAVLPPAAVNYLLAETYQQEPKKMAAIVLAGNIASLVFVPLGLALAIRTQAA
jgi:malate permease and related proteins